MFLTAMNYFKEAWAELRKVSWPSRKQTIDLTIAVVAISIFVALLIGAYDLGLRTGVKAYLDSKSAQNAQSLPVGSSGQTGQ